MNRLQRAVHLVLDFDSTLTVSDTIALFQEVPIQRNKRLGNQGYPTPSWSSVERAYMEDFTRHQSTEGQHESPTQRKPFVGQARDYSQMVARRRIVEEQSSRRLEEWNYFRGVTRTDVCRAAEAVLRDGRLVMRDHWSQLLRMFIPKDNTPGVVQWSKVSIISLNWSTTFIRQCLLGSLRSEGGHCADLVRFINNDLEIDSNEIEGLDDTEGSNGRLRSEVHSSADKLCHLAPASLRSNACYPDRKPDPESPYLVYVGDSSTDFDCLMAADAGIWLCPAKTPEDAQEECSKCFKPLMLRIRHIEGTHTEPLRANELLWAQNFGQISLHLAQIAP